MSTLEQVVDAGTSGENAASGLARQLDWLKTQLRGDVAGAWPAAPDSALDALAERFGLSPFARALLLFAAAPDLDGEALALITARDVRHPWPTLALAWRLFGASDPAALAPDAPLRAFDLVRFGGDGALATRALYADERVVFALCEVATIDAWLAPWLSALPGRAISPPRDPALADALARALADEDDPLVVLCGGTAAERRAHILDAARLIDANAWLLTLPDAQQPDPDPLEFVRRWRREAALAANVLVVDASGWPARWLHALEQLSTCVVAADTPPALDGLRAQKLLRIGDSGIVAHAARWRATHPALDRDGALRLAAEFRHAPEQIAIDMFSTPGTTDDDARAARAEHAAQSACRALTAAGMSGLADRIDSPVNWDDLVLPAEQAGQLRDLAQHAAARAVVGEAWGFTRRGGRGHGIAALFSGPPGTGKTLAARIVARGLGHDLYRVDLSRVVSKYVGETEKNLARVFDAADAGGAVLLFDEADALFGKRSEVKDSHDRYANLEIAYLLQRIEAFNGLAILTSNLDRALDAAFLRRLAFVVRFPFPGEAARHDIWTRAFPADAPCAALPFARLARLPVAGGHIAAIAWSAACRAAQTSGTIELEHVIAAARAECAKLDKPWQEGWLREDAR